jgi:hypothetical protein
VEHAQSSAIGTVTIVTWSSDLAGISEAHIDFGLRDSAWSMSAPVDLSHEGYRTLLLGMKAARDHGFRIVATSALGTCTSDIVPLTTGPLPPEPMAPILIETEEQVGGVEGFFVATPGISAGTTGPVPGAFVFDTDGDLVWWTPDAISHISAAQMSWDGRAMWYVNANGGLLYRTSMDGLSTQAFDVGSANHDLVPLPEGTMALFARAEGADPLHPDHLLAEVDDEGVVTEIVRLREIYQTAEGYHPNALGYYLRDDTFTISDLELDGFVKVTRLGELVWQLGGDNPKGDFFELIGLERAGGHGHDLGPNGQFVYFDNFFEEEQSAVVELLLDEDTWTAEQRWQYPLGSVCQFLGGAQHLPNGNTSIAYSTGGLLHEVTPSGDLLRTFDTEVSAGGTFSMLGYVRFRRSLYGPPQSYWDE